ncbi:hypothetical protein HELRODRAFT_173176 [Helobdella robusta]|uniref:Uncharacterized protein n=1 Tax=Helobdella robusta TaxID=6412 RepID=T1F6I6_HELRO|nr:hypothetical protein HELRODRAFT_173176 [Helobdella robusta]ESO04098.1 hypothetical protein HELRODRAFT_173176 [Helobdella robusta]
MNLKCNGNSKNSNVCMNLKCNGNSKKRSQKDRKNNICMNLKWPEYNKEITIKIIFIDSISCKRCFLLTRTPNVLICTWQDSRILAVLVNCQDMNRLEMIQDSRILAVLVNCQDMNRLEDRNQYPIVKDALLRQFGATEEKYRKKLFHSVPDHKDDPRLFVTNVTMYFDRWLAMADVNQTYEAIRNYIILDTVINAYSDQVQVFVKEPRKLPIQYKPVSKVFFAKILQGDGKLVLFTAFVNQCKCTTLRNSGTTTLLVHQDCVEPHSYTGEYGNIKDFKDCTRSDVIQWQNNHEVNRSMAITRTQSRREKDLKKLDQNYSSYNLSQNKLCWGLMMRMELIVTVIR